MPKFSQRSLTNLANVHPDLQLIAHEAIKEIDFIVTHGHRTPEEQNALYQQGRTKPGKIVTYKDGIKNKSKHNESPSLAIDIVPFPVDWSSIDKFKAIGKVFKEAAVKLAAEGKITHKLIHGGDWVKFKDYPHFELAKK
jgi:peptidoglycan L-alanyl-D-glutamate endopeptidase CwlK